jgi:hypothetical protein
MKICPINPQNPESRKLYTLGYAVTQLDADEILKESDHQLVIARIKPLHSGVRRLILNDVLTPAEMVPITNPL